MRSFASDNNAGIHPKILEAICAANNDHAPGYGDDPWTRQAEEAIQKHFGADIEIAFTLNGTGANVIALALMTQPYHAVICSNFAHIAVDECSAPERFTGCKLITIDCPDGKLTPEKIKPALRGHGDQHHAQAKVISISQSNELGLLYSCEEVRALAAFARANGLYLHMDGARLANAAAALGLSLRECSRDLGLDLLSFGATKNGLMCGEAVLVFNRDLFGKLKFVRKQATQLASKMRFISAQFIALLEGELWLENANHANTMAKNLAAKIETRGLKPVRPVQANAVFVRLNSSQIKELQRKHFFYVWDEASGEVRWMTSFDTQKADIDRFVADIESVIA